MLRKRNLILCPTEIHVRNLSRSVYHWICVLVAIREAEKCGWEIWWARGNGDDGTREYLVNGNKMWACSKN